MKKFTTFAILTLLTLLMLLMLPNLTAGDVLPPPLLSDLQMTSVGASADKAARDSVLVLFTDFQSGSTPSWEGWTSVDVTAQDGIHWQIDDYLAASLDPSVTGNHAWSCNTFDYPACSSSDSSGGYGNMWYQTLEFEAEFNTVEKAVQSVRIEGICLYCPDDEDDTLYLEAETEPDLDKQVHPIDPVASGTHDIPIDELFYFDLPFPAPGEKALVTVKIRFVFVSDDRSSDEDCEAPADCGILLDNLRVTINGVLVDDHVEDCEPGTPVRWTPGLPVGVGDFARIHTDLGDLDPCAENATPQVAFVDDSVLGMACLSWCYGPSGYIVNTQGGLAGPEFSLYNEIHSPAIAWPGTGEYTGGTLSFDMYQHSLPAPNAPGIFYHWKVRSTSSSDPGHLINHGWVDRSFVYYGDAGYSRANIEVGDLIVPGAQWVQVALGVREIDALWPGTGDDGTPAPYYDNISFMAYPEPGPILWATPAELAQDAFPASGILDHANPANNHVRFDMARAQGGSREPGVAAGDSIVCTVTPLGEGNSLTGPPVLHYLIKPNPLFDPERYHPVTGTTNGLEILNEAGVLIENRWAFDLPDEGLLFPGDRLHYFIRGEQTGGNWATLPDDTTGYAQFGLESPYDHVFTVRALPSITGWWQNPWDLSWIPYQPLNLWWNDADDSGSRKEWIMSMRNLGLVEGVDIDIYETNAPEAGLGNGLGGRATPSQIVAYNRIMYSSGDRAAFTLGTSEPGGDPGDDVGLLMAHPAGYNLLLTGAHWASDLNRTTAGQNFLANNAGVALVGPETRPLVGTILGLDVYTPVGSLVDGLSYWSLLGNCWDHEYDAIVPTGSATRFGEYLDSIGDPGAYSLAAWVFTSSPRTVWSLPYDLASVLAARDPANRLGGPLAARTHILKGFLSPNSGSGEPSPVPEVAECRIHPATPNPFNPRTVIRLDLTGPAHVKADVYDLRGRLVRTLEDGPYPAGSHSLVWDGDDNHGQATAAGVYFCRVQALGRTLTQKVALVR